jgi:hypothetical protein
MVHFQILIHGTEEWTVGQVAAALQNYIICLEMVPLMIAFALAFGYK